MFTSSFRIILISFSFCILHFEFSASFAQEQKKLTEQEVTEILTAFRSNNNTAILEASKKLKNVEPIPAAIAEQLVQFYGDPYLPAKRIASTRYLRKVKFDEKLVGLLLETLADERFKDLNYPLGALKRFLNQPGRKIIPLLRAACIDKNRHRIAREIPFAALMEFDNLPESVTKDFPELLKISGGPWSEGAYSLAENGKEKALAALLESENKWQAIRAAGALEKHFPGRYSEALDKLIEVAFVSTEKKATSAKNDYEIAKEAAKLLARSGFQNSYLILQLGLRQNSQGIEVRSTFVKLLQHNDENQVQLRKLLPILTSWSKQPETRDGVLLWYRAIGVENESVFDDLMQLIKSSDEEYSNNALRLFQFRSDHRISLKAADNLLRNDSSRKFAFQLLTNLKHKCGTIAKTIVQQIIVNEKKTTLDHGQIVEQRQLFGLLDSATSISANAGPHLIELASTSPELRGFVISWLKKTENANALDGYQPLLAWNNRVITAEFSGDFFSKAHRNSRSPTRRARFSHDGLLLAMFKEDQLNIFDSKSKKINFRIPLPKNIHDYFEPYFDRSSKYVLAKYRDSSSFIWNIQSGRLVTKTTNSAIHFLDMPDRAILVDEHSKKDKDENSLHAVKLPGFEITSTINYEQNAKWPPSINSAGRFVLICTPMSVNRSDSLHLEVREANSLTLVSTLNYPIKKFHNPNLYSSSVNCKLSPSGKSLAMLHNHGIIEILTTSDLETVASHHFVDNASTLSYYWPEFSPDETKVAYRSSDGFVRLWNLNNDEKISQIRTRKFGKIHFSKDSRWIVQSNHAETNTVVIASTSDPKKIATIFVEGETLLITPLSDGELFEIATDKKILLLDSKKIDLLFKKTPALD